MIRTTLSAARMHGNLVVPLGLLLAALLLYYWRVLVQSTSLCYVVCRMIG